MYLVKMSSLEHFSRKVNLTDLGVDDTLIANILFAVIREQPRVQSIIWS